MTKHPGKRPGVLIVHQWKGLGSYEKKRAEMLANLGYTVFALDIYGKGIRADNPKDASALAAKYKNDRALLRERAKSGLGILKKHELTDPERIAAIGYCFGGTTVLELARSGADLDGIVSFHGALGTPDPKDARNIKGKVLALHGADDPFVPPAEVSGFEEEMQAKVIGNWSLRKPGAQFHHWGCRQQTIPKGAATTRK
jgi:dienelactone hydrolase